MLDTHGGGGIVLKNGDLQLLSMQVNDNDQLLYIFLGKSSTNTHTVKDNSGFDYPSQKEK